MKQTPEPSPAFIEAVNNFLSDTFHNGDRAAFNYQTGCFYDCYLCGNVPSASQRDSDDFYAKFCLNEGMEPPSKCGRPINGLQHDAWTASTTSTVRAFVEAHELDAGLFADVWLLFCAVNHRVTDGWYKKNTKPLIDGLADAKQQIERDVLPFLAALYAPHTHKSPVGNGLAVRFTTVANGRAKSLKLTGYLAEVILSDLHQKAKELLANWEARPEIKKERKDLVRTGIADSAKFIWLSMKTWHILEAQTAFNANNAQKLFIWDFLVAAGIDMESRYAGTYSKETAIHQLLNN